MTDSRIHVDSSSPEFEWWRFASCRGMADNPGYDPFFPEGRGRPLRNQEAEAIEVCLDCPVAEWCLDDAEQRRDHFGIRGGYAAWERGWIRQ